jgi:hypothetical protein
MHFFTTLAVGVLSFSATISAIDYPTVAELVSNEKERAGAGIQSFGQRAAALNVTGYDFENSGSPWAVCLLLSSSRLAVRKCFNSEFVQMIDHDVNAFARAIHYDFVPQNAPTAPKINTSADANALLNGWHNVCIIFSKLPETKNSY